MAKLLHREDIKAKIRKKYGTLKEFERQKSLPSRSVKDVLLGRKNAGVSRAIASEMGVADFILITASKNQKKLPIRHSKSPKGDCHCLNAGVK